MTILERNLAVRVAVVCSLLFVVGCDDDGIMIPDSGPPMTMDSGQPDAGPPMFSCDDGERNGNETGVDCGGDECDACPAGDPCVQPSDCVDNVCERGRCLMGTCDDGVRNGTETGGDCGLCRGGEMCTDNEQCISGRCRAGVCTESSCEDGTQNNDETDIDCGGTMCDPCIGGLTCVENTDCESLICSMGACTTPACNDSVQNQDETSVDCGGGTCPPCRDGLGCMMDSDCAGMRCFMGGCVSCMDRIVNAEETDEDCGGPLCPACADGRMCVMDSDCEGMACESGLCVSCMDGVQNQDETDVDCGGATCPGCADGLTCTVDGDCGALGATCVAGSCVSCADRVQNRDETDVDCGGATCPGCAPGLTCTGNSDCLSNICDGPTMTCNAPGCGDGIRNGAETDVDCGGGSCIGCATGLSCTVATDCLDGVCTGGVCQAPTCTDGVRNGAETDIDCGGPTTCPRCMDRQRCTAATDCTAGVCTSPPGRCGTFTGCNWGLIAQESQFSDTTIQGLLTGDGHIFTVHNMNGTGGVHSSNLALLNMYDAVIVHEHDRILSAAELTALTSYINGGGRVIVTGYDSLGSPTDSVLAGLLRCGSPGDGPFSGSLTVSTVTHPILTGPAQTFTSGMALTSGSTDHDRCTPIMGAVRLVDVSGSSKLQIAEGIGPNNGMVVYWNGNGTGSGALVDWVGTSGTQPALQNLFVNVLNYLCSTP